MKQYTIEELNSLQKEEVVALMVQLQRFVGICCI